jgi:hypothetical protein
MMNGVPVRKRGAKRLPPEKRRGEFRRKIPAGEKSMYRIEIIANNSVQDNILEAFQEEGAGKNYTLYTSVLGVGSSGPRMGDAIWPEENFALVVWCEKEEAEGLARAVAAVKKRFPGEGVKIFGLPE